MWSRTFPSAALLPLVPGPRPRTLPPTVLSGEAAASMPASTPAPSPETGTANEGAAAADIARMACTQNGLGNFALLQPYRSVGKTMPRPLATRAPCTALTCSKSASLSHLKVGAIAGPACMQPRESSVKWMRGQHGVISWGVGASVGGVGWERNGPGRLSTLGETWPGSYVEMQGPPQHYRMRVEPWGCSRPTATDALTSRPWQPEAQPLHR